MNNFINYNIFVMITYRSTDLKLNSYMKLPNTAECQQIPKMPNRVSPSDHLPLFAKFCYSIS